MALPGKRGVWARPRTALPLLLRRGFGGAAATIGGSNGADRSRSPLPAPCGSRRLRRAFCSRAQESSIG